MFKYIFLFIIYFIAICIYLFGQYSEKLSIQEQVLKSSADRSLKAATNLFEVLDSGYFNQIESSMVTIIKDATDATPKARDAIRYKLRQKFTKLYNDRKLEHIKTFHIFDRNGVSLLRFHELNRYDDRIIEKRDSLKKLQTQYRFQRGFEIGLYAVAYRFQYPLFYDGEFVGSYEFGIGFDTIDQEMRKIFGIKNLLFIDKKNLFESNKKFVYKKVKIADRVFYLFKTKGIKSCANRLKKVINKLKEMSDEDFKKCIRISDNQKDYITVLTPVKDIVGKDIGFILTIVEDKTSKIFSQTFVKELVFAFLFGFIIFYFAYRDLKHRKYERNIINTQHDILIVTDGEKLLDANQAFLDFFGVKSLREFFKNGHNCICDFFLKKDGYIQKQMHGVSWVDYLKKHKDDTNIAVMKDKNQQEVYFEIRIESFKDSNDFVMLFIDVTKELKKRKELENKAYYDKLTGIYSRERFEYFLDLKLHQKRAFSLIMFDIDHFKLVNDNYGHDVGDSVLKELAMVVTEHKREEDVFARWGGEEFMIITDTTLAGAEKFANKLRVAIRSYNFKYVKKVTCSFGVTQYKIGDNKTTITKRVDDMLYRAKKSGRDCVIIDAN